MCIPFETVWSAWTAVRPHYGIYNAPCHIPMGLLRFDQDGMTGINPRSLTVLHVSSSSYPLPIAIKTVPRFARLAKRQSSKSNLPWAAPRHCPEDSRNANAIRSFAATGWILVFFLRGMRRRIEHRFFQNSGSIRMYIYAGTVHRNNVDFHLDYLLLPQLCKGPVEYSRSCPPAHVSINRVPITVFFR